MDNRNIVIKKKEKISFINNSYMEDLRQNSVGMSPLSHNGGFTLIELLVVVLIIGILAAGAGPQYRKAVSKAQATQLLISLDAIIKSYRIYNLSNGEFPTSMDDLDLTPIQGNSESKIEIINEKMRCFVLHTAKEFACKYDNQPNVPSFFYFAPNHSVVNGRNKRVCRAINSSQEEICLNMGAIFLQKRGNDMDYFLP